MSYYQYMVSEYSSSPLNRSYRSSSVERSSMSSTTTSYSGGINRFNRAATVGPCTSNEAYNVSYYGYMPFNRSLVDIENRIKTRQASSIARSLASAEPVNTYRRAYHTYSPYGGYSTFDYKSSVEAEGQLEADPHMSSSYFPPYDCYVSPSLCPSAYVRRTSESPERGRLSPSPYRSAIFRYYQTRFDPRLQSPAQYPSSSQVHDYASHLDKEESTRAYMNQFRGDFYNRRAAMGLGAHGSETAERYRSDVDTRDLYTYKHYRKSNATLTDRNARAKSPILGRELDRYYKTERRSDYLGDVSSGAVRDFRHYNYRSVPYFGGSDYYALSQQRKASIV